jgi:Flp pilus assembly protein TadG
VSILHRLLRDQQGNTAIIFGLAIIPLIALGGGIVDFAHRANLRGELQTAVDTAAIGAARAVQHEHLQDTEDQNDIDAAATGAARRILDAGLASIGGSDAANVSVDVDGGIIRIAAHYDVDTSFLGVIGIKTLTANAMAEVSLPDVIRVEVALVLDYSKSMEDDDKYVRMTDAARDFIAKVAKDRAETSKIGIVPFSQYVYARIGASYVRDSGSGHHDQNDDGGGWGGWGSSGSGSVNTCLLNRDYPYSTTDGAPFSGLPSSQWPEGDAAKCDDYADAHLRVRDLTDEFSSLSDSLSAMEPVGLTNIALAMEIGWHMLTPDAPFDQARNASDNVQKIIIVLTDGMQTVPAMGPSGDVSTAAADETTAELCENAKEQGVRIFSIAYDVINPEVHQLLLGCASSDTGYFDAGVSEISGVFNEIYSQIAETVWLSR